MPARGLGRPQFRCRRSVSGCTGLADIATRWPGHLRGVDGRAPEHAGTRRGRAARRVAGPGGPAGAAGSRRHHRVLGPGRHLAARYRRDPRPRVLAGAAATRCWSRRAGALILSLYGRVQTAVGLLAQSGLIRAGASADHRALAWPGQACLPPGSVVAAVGPIRNRSATASRPAAGSISGGRSSPVITAGGLRRGRPGRIAGTENRPGREMSVLRRARRVSALNPGGARSPCHRLSLWSRG
jgi:hypothetical protein